jgi:hypothetical protein
MVLKRIIPAKNNVSVMCGIQYSRRVRKENSKNAAPAGHQSKRIKELVRKGIK